MHSPSCDPDSALLDTASDRALPLGPQAAQTVQTGALRGCGHPYECTERMFCLGPGPFQSKLGIFPQCHVRKAAQTLNLFRAVPLKDDVGLQGAGDRAQRVTWSPFSWCLASFGVGVGLVREESPSCSESGWQKAVRSPERL